MPTTFDLDLPTHHCLPDRLSGDKDPDQDTFPLLWCFEGPLAG